MTKDRVIRLAVEALRKGNKITVRSATERSGMDMIPERLPRPIGEYARGKITHVFTSNEPLGSAEFEAEFDAAIARAFGTLQ